MTIPETSPELKSESSVFFVELDLVVGPEISEFTSAGALLAFLEFTPILVVDVVKIVDISAVVTTIVSDVPVNVVVAAGPVVVLVGLDTTFVVELLVVTAVSAAILLLVVTVVTDGIVVVVVLTVVVVDGKLMLLTVVVVDVVLGSQYKSTDLHYH